MSRWEPNARERLVGAAMELFVDRGYEGVTIAEIAERAGLTKRTFFRHFADKREILFGGQDMLRQLFAEAIAGAPVAARPMEAVSAGLQAFAAGFGPERRDFAMQRQALIAAHPDLQERDLLKRAALNAAMAEALRERGIEEPTASLAAQIGDLALSAAYLRWLEPANQQTLADLAEEALRDLTAATAALG
jgi:AcrR family transcriptional regulator